MTTELSYQARQGDVVRYDGLDWIVTSDRRAPDGEGVVLVLAGDHRLRLVTVDSDNRVVKEEK